MRIADNEGSDLHTSLLGCFETLLVSIYTGDLELIQVTDRHILDLYTWGR